MRELELKEKKIKEIQSTGDRLLREGHPARPTVEVGWARPVVAGGGWAEGGTCLGRSRLGVVAGCVGARWGPQ